MAEPRLQWFVSCSCGWEREASSAWAATAVAVVHARLLLVSDAEHTVMIEEPPADSELWP